jgi:cysteine desulfurase/selenocysteine lyase
MPPYQFGGGMIYEADLFSASWQKAPQKFEAGTPPIAQAIGLAAAIEYIQKHISFDELQKHEAALCAQLIDGLSSIKKVRILGPVDALKKSGHLVSFVIDGIHPHDVAAMVSKKGICVRAGNHCAQPLTKVLNISGSVRASFYVYNTEQEVEQLLEAIKQLL